MQNILSLIVIAKMFNIFPILKLICCFLTITNIVYS